MTQMPIMTSKLNAAEPTMVPGPSPPGSASFSRSGRVSITERRISGAEEPRAISVRLATVAFQTKNVTSPSDPSALIFVIFFSLLVITSIAAMNTSAMMATPKNADTMAQKKMKMCGPLFHIISPGKKGMNMPPEHGSSPSLYSKIIRPDSNSNTCTGPHVLQLPPSFSSKTLGCWHWVSAPASLSSSQRPME